VSIGTPPRPESRPSHTNPDQDVPTRTATRRHAPGRTDPVQVALSPTDTDPATRATDDLDPRLSELVGFADVARTTGLSYWSFHNAYRRGAIRGVPVPGGAIGLLRKDVTAFLRDRRNRQQQRAGDAA
jgi:hypothetical protein